MLPRNSSRINPNRRINKLARLFGISPYFLYLWSINENTQVWTDLLKLYELGKSFRLGCFALWIRERHIQFNWKTPYEMILNGETTPLLTALTSRH